MFSTLIFWPSAAAVTRMVPAFCPTVSRTVLTSTSAFIGLSPVNLPSPVTVKRTGCAALGTTVPLTSTDAYTNSTSFWPACGSLPLRSMGSRKPTRWAGVDVVQEPIKVVFLRFYSLGIGQAGILAVFNRKARRFFERTSAYWRKGHSGILVFSSGKMMARG